MSYADDPLEDTRAQPGMNIAVVATFAAEPIGETLSFWMEQAQIRGRVRFAPYNQVVQQLRDLSSLVATNTGGANIVLLRLEDWAGDDDQPAAVEQHVRDFLEARAVSAASAPALDIVGICPASTRVAGDATFSQALEQIRQRLIAQLEPPGDVEVLDLSAAITRYQVDEWYDPLADELGHMPYTFEFFAAMGTAIAQALFAARNIPFDDAFQTGVQILRAVRAQQRTWQVAESSFVAPRDEVERVLAEMLAEVLGLDRVGIHDNFFELGGDSMLAMDIISRIHTAFQIETPLMTVFFETPTVAGLAEAITQDAAGAGDVEQTAQTLQTIMRLSDEEIELMRREHPL